MEGRETAIYYRPANAPFAKPSLCFSVGSRGDLAKPDAVAWLQYARGGGASLYCGCHGGEPLWPRLAVRMKHGRLECFRVRISEHAPRCVFADLYVTSEDEPPPAIGAELGNVVVGAADLVAPVDAEAKPSSGYVTFTATITRLVAEVGTDAVLASFEKHERPVQPDGMTWFSSWEKLLDVPRFRGELSPRLAAKEKGVELLVGITFGDPLVCAGSESLFGAHWWAHGVLNRRVYAIGTVELEEAIRPLFRRRGRMSPPYLCVATLEPDGRLRRLWLRPIWTDGRSFAVCDSEAERRFLHQAREEGAVIFKPMLISDLGRLASVLPARKGAIQWAHLPDALVWRAAAPVEIVEVKGSREGPDPDYDQRLAVKAAYYASLSPKYHYRQVEGWRLQEVATTVHSLEGIPMGEDEISMRAIMLVRAKRAEVCCKIME